MITARVRTDGTTLYTERRGSGPALLMISGGGGDAVYYGEVAEQLGLRHVVRAVGAAIGQNPLLIVVPCHRVIGADGKLTGYAGGLQRKRQLLDLESPALVASRLF